MDILNTRDVMECRRCPKFLWLEAHNSDCWDDSASMASPDYVENDRALQDIFRRLFDPTGEAFIVQRPPLIDRGDDLQDEREDELQAIRRALDDGKCPVFYPVIESSGFGMYAHLMLPERHEGTLKWHAIYHTSSIRVQQVDRDRTAINGYIASEIGFPLASLSVVHIDANFIKQGSDDIDELLIRVDLTKEAEDRHDEIKRWIAETRATIGLRREPEIAIGSQCHAPYTCGFLNYCAKKNSASGLPNYLGTRLDQIKPAVDANTESRVPDEVTRRIRECAANGQPYLDSEAASAELAHYGYPAYFLHFDTIALAVPYWKGTRPYQQVAYQFGLKILKTENQMTYRGYLNTNANDPFEDCAHFLIRQCGSQGAIFVYRAQPVMEVLQGLAEQCPELEDRLISIQNRLVDLLPIVQHHYYHSHENGLWDLDTVLPAICSGLAYRELDPCHDDFFMPKCTVQTLMAGDSSEEWLKRLNYKLMAYGESCAMALVRVWKALKGGDLETELLNIRRKTGSLPDA